MFDLRHHEQTLHVADIGEDGKFFIEDEVVFADVFAGDAEQEVEGAGEVVAFHDLGNFYDFGFLR